MILQFFGTNYSLLRVNNALPEEMSIIRLTVSAKVTQFRRGRSGWDGMVDHVYWIDPYYYVPAGCWKRLMALNEPDPKTYRLAYNVQFLESDKFFNKDITMEEIQTFVEPFTPTYFDDVTDQISALHAVLFFRMSSHHIATGFGKTFLAYLIAQYTRHYYEKQCLIIVPRTGLVIQTVDEFYKFMNDCQLPEEDRLKVHGICGGFRNIHAFADSDVIIGTFQSLSNMPDDCFDDVYTCVADEGHTSKADSVLDTAKKCLNAQLFTSISGTLSYMEPADELAIETVFGPRILEYRVHQQIEKGRLPKVAIQPIILVHHTGREHYEALIQSERLPMPNMGEKNPDLATKYRLIEFKFLWYNEPMLNFILNLCHEYTKQGLNVLVIFKNVAPCINLFELAQSKDIKSHLIIGATPKHIRAEIKADIEANNGYILVATDGTMSMGESINNLQGLCLCMIGHSPHVTLQGLGRMLRNHPDKFDVTLAFDISNDLRLIGGSSFDLNNRRERKKYYLMEQYPVYKTIKRNI